MEAKEFMKNPKGFVSVLTTYPELITPFREAVEEVRSPEEVAVAGLGNLFKGFDD